MRPCVFALVSCLQIALFDAMGNAAAEEVGDIYGGLSYSKTFAKDTSANHLGTYKPMTFGVGLSVVAMPYLALDGYVFTGVEDARNDLPLSRTMTVSAIDGYGFNLRPFSPLSQSWSVYAKLGRQYGAKETVLKIYRARSRSGGEHRMVKIHLIETQVTINMYSPSYQQKEKLGLSGTSKQIGSYVRRLTPIVLNGALGLMV